MVADQDRDPVAGSEATSTPGVCERFDALVQLPIAELPPLVADRDAVGVANRADRDRAGEQTVTLERVSDPRHPLRRLDPEHAGAEADPGEVRLVAGPSGELGAGAEQALQVDVELSPAPHGA